MEHPEPNIELVVARSIADVSMWGIGRELGEPLLHDDNSEDGMVDILFPDAVPPVAMEVTAIVDGEFVATADAAQRAVEAGLQAVAEDAGHNLHWLFNVVRGARIRQLAPFMEGRVRSGDTSNLDLPPGLFSLRVEHRDEPGVTIGTWSDPAAGSLRGITTDLIHAIESKKTKLGMTESHERHLAVDVQALRASDPGASPAPPLPDEIDLLWVVRRAYSLMRGTPVVWVTDGLGGWKVNGEPHEAM